MKATSQKWPDPKLKSNTGRRHPSAATDERGHDVNDSKYERERRRYLKGLLRYIGPRIALCEKYLALDQQMRARYPDGPQPPPTAAMQRWLAHLDRTAAVVKDLLAGRLPLDTHVPLANDIHAGLGGLVREWEDYRRGLPE